MADIIPIDPEQQALLTLMENEGVLTEEEQEELNAQFPKPDISAHDANLAEVLDENTLARMAQEVCDTFEEDEDSRKDWYCREREAIRLLGISENIVEGANFDGACSRCRSIPVPQCDAKSEVAWICKRIGVLRALRAAK